MALTFVKELPGMEKEPVSPGRVPYAAEPIKEFLAARGRKYAKVTLENEKGEPRKGKAMHQAFRDYLKKNPKLAERVKVHLIDGDLYLERLPRKGNAGAAKTESEPDASAQAADDGDMVVL
jgi:hypothetical protein